MRLNVYLVSATSKNLGDMSSGGGATVSGLEISQTPRTSTIVRLERGANQRQGPGRSVTLSPITRNGATPRLHFWWAHTPRTNLYSAIELQVVWSMAFLDLELERDPLATVDGIFPRCEVQDARRCFGVHERDPVWQPSRRTGVAAACRSTFSRSAATDRPTSDRSPPCHLIESSCKCHRRTRT